MGFLLKPRITEQEAAEIFLDLLARNVERSWERIFEVVRPTMGARTVVVDNQKAAQSEFFTAALVLHLEQLETIFDRERSLRIREQVLRGIAKPPFSEPGGALDPANEESLVTLYRRQWQGAVTSQQDPVEALAALLYERLGAGFSAREHTPAEAAEKGRRAFALILANFGVGWWRSFTHKYRITRPKAGRS